ncbi:MAG: hypothetical protein FWF28_01935 [Micrococcales bacterium]|nr:hypothetical protein [Micrococcales bacterium]
MATDSLRGCVEISLTGEGADYEAAESCANSSTRTAIHTIEGATPGWEFTATHKRSELVDA